MSAIWGVWHRDGRPRAKQDIEAMQGCLRGYGRDRHQVWVAPDATAGLGLAATHTLPEDDADTQPYTTPGGAVLVGHVRLDNRDDLARELGLCRGSALRPDLEILAAAWERWNTEAVVRLVGDFAFAVWEPARRRLVCARDAMGMRPLHYAVAGSLVAFATMPKGLNVLAEFPRKADHEMIAGRLAMLPENGDRSFFENIRRLPSSHMLIATPDQVRVERYWTFDTGRRVTLANDQAYVEAFLQHFDEAVRCRLRSRGPVGSLFSGGLDSTSVATSAALQLASQGATLNAYTAVPSPEFDGHAPRGRFGDEGPHAASTARLYPNINHFLVPPASACPLELMPEIQRWLDGPGGHFCMSPAAHAMSEIHVQHGVTTMLTGLAGNLTISYDGLYLLPALVGAGRWFRWASEARALHASQYVDRWRGIGLVSLGPMIPAPLWKLLLRKRPGKFLTALTGYTMLDPGWIHSGEFEALARSRGADPWNQPLADGRVARVRGLHARDGAGAASPGSRHGIDYRDPTSDRRLIEFLLAIPEDQFLRQGQTKWLLRRAMAGRLSPMVLQERRKGLVGVDWHLRISPYRERFAEAVEECRASPVLSGLLDFPRLRRLVDRWPRQNWDSPRIQAEYRAGLCRTVSAGRFVRMVEQGTA